jgi:small-conductance mechanosensitive channel
LLGRPFQRNLFLRDLVRQVVRLAITMAGFVLALDLLDASRLLTTLLGAAGVVGLALGFALRDTVENYIASLLLSLRQPFAHDDHVIIDGCEGRVVRLTPRATILMTLDGNHTRIPNATVYKAVIVNYTTNPKRRFAFDVGVSTEQNLAEAQELAARTLGKMEGVLDEPQPFCLVETLGDSNVVLQVFGWVDQSATEFLKVRSEAIRLVKLAFDQANIVMPEPIYNLRMQTGQLQEAQGSTAATLRPGAASSAGAVEEPRNAVDIGRKYDLDHQMAHERSNSAAEDLLSKHAPRE